MKKLRDLRAKAELIADVGRVIGWPIDGMQVAGWLSLVILEVLLCVVVLSWFGLL